MVTKALASGWARTSPLAESAIAALASLPPVADERTEPPIQPTEPEHDPTSGGQYVGDPDRWPFGAIQSTEGEA